MASTKPLGEECPLKDNLDSKTNTVQPAPLAGDDYVCLNYWRRTNDGRLLFGSLADSYRIPQWLAKYRLRRALREVYPQLADVPLDHVWSGTLAFARNAIPLIGRDKGFDYKDDNQVASDGGIWYATGFGGHGIVPTCMAGSILADAILGIDDDTWRVFQNQFPPQYAFWPFGRIGGELLLTVYNVFDWLHVKGVPVPRLPKPW
jgi:glycine/D-amino acid oxidase-like deaminating enzyme